MTEQTGLIIVGVLSLAGLFPILRPYRALKLSKRMTRIAQSSLREATSRGKEQDPEFMEFHESALGLSVCVPVLASGVFANPMNASSDPEDRPRIDTLRQYIDVNSWLMPSMRRAVMAAPGKLDNKTRLRELPNVVP